MKRSVASLVVVLCALALCCSAALAETTLKVGGGSAPMENIFKRIKEPFQKKTGIMLELHEIGPVDSYIELMADRLDVASAGLGSLKQWETMVEKSGKEGTERKGKLHWHIIGNDFVTLYTHKEVGVSELTADQVKGIFTGKIANWKEVGGPDAPIAVVLGNKVQGLMTEFQNKVLGGAAFAPSAAYVDSANDMKNAVKKTPGAVSIGTLAQTLDQEINVVVYPAPKRDISIMWKFESPKREAIQTLYQYLRSGEALPYILTQKMKKD